MHMILIVTSYCTVPLAIENYDVEIEALVVPQSTLRYDIILGFDQMKRTNIYLAPDPQVQAKPIYYNNQIKELGTSTEICLRNPQQQVNQIQRGIVKVGSRPNFAQQRQKAIVECEQAMVLLSKRQRSRVLKALMIANYPYYWRCVKKVSQKQRTDN